jgi:hypothetical protein
MDAGFINRPEPMMLPTTSATPGRNFILRKPIQDLKIQTKKASSEDEAFKLIFSGFNPNIPVTFTETYPRPGYEVFPGRINR